MSSTDPHSRFWPVSASLGAVLVIFFSGVNAALRDTEYGNFKEFGAGLCLGLFAIVLSLALVALLTRLLAAVPRGAVVLLLATALALYVLFDYSPMAVWGDLLKFHRGDSDVPGWSIPDAFSFSGVLLITLGLAALGALLFTRSSQNERRITRPQQIGAVLSAVVAVFLIVRIADNGGDPFANDGTRLTAVESPTTLADPSAPGPMAYTSLTYGAGENPRRPEFAEARDLDSRTVDARPLLPQWRGFRGERRELYWGFGLDEAPLNGRVWMPEGAGPFPLVLIVHGNHGMEDYSDDGYAYLTELLASRGYIAVSVDQNYINGSWSGDFRGKEMAARAWLLLEHLALWRDWNQTEGHPFAGRVDLERIALIGHSRGGEAVSIAQRFNSLPYFPDDATVSFDYNFGIRSLVAIAQVDQRYQRRVRLQDVNFFTIHGSYDSDEPAYHGLRQMNRIAFSGQDYFLKAGVYVHGANHGQFNTGWGRHDFSLPGAWRLNTAPIIPAAEQRQAALVYISAFLDVTLNDKTEYRGFLRDPRVGADWLPARHFVAQFQDSSFKALANFEEDIDVSTATLADAEIRTDKLVVWREQALTHRDQRLQGSNAVEVAWREPGALLAIETLAAEDFSGAERLELAVSASPSPLPQAPAGDKVGSGSGDDARAGETGRDAKTDNAADLNDQPPGSVDFSIELRDVSGRTASVVASDHALLTAPVRVRYLKNQADNQENYNADWEPVLQHISVPLTAFAVQGVDTSAVTAVSLRFDRDAKGRLLIDNIGLAGDHADSNDTLAPVAILD